MRNIKREPILRGDGRIKFGVGMHSCFIGKLCVEVDN